jgi:hypothetical protein
MGLPALALYCGLKLKLSGASTKLAVRWSIARRRCVMGRRVPLRAVTDEERQAVARLARARTAPARAVERAQVVRAALEGAALEGAAVEGAAVEGAAVEDIAVRLHLARNTV